jgi:UDP-N-acetylmuramyl pentapeptide phosphotransferase/UDP-N-acetylglucosamine-1-phosphate transferase
MIRDYFKLLTGWIVVFVSGYLLLASFDISAFAGAAIMAGVLLVASALSAAAIVILKPLLLRYALARPNARSSHKTPTPQGGGIAVVGAALITALLLATVLEASYGGLQPFMVLAGASIALAALGAVDDIRPLPAGLRLLLQAAAVTAVIVTSGIRILPDWIPLSLEQALLIFGGVWFVNLVNFMDGLDWITVAEMVPVTASVAIFSEMTHQPFPVAIIAIALSGALLGFAPFNKPVARLFLGDVGSLPIGLIVGWLLLQLAGTGALAAALLLPLYYLMDATITLLRRLAKRERVWEAHRSHFYQRATDNGFSVMAVVTHVFVLNLALAALAAVTLLWPSSVVQIGALAAGLLLVGFVLRRFSHPRMTAPLEVSR